MMMRPTLPVTSGVKDSPGAAFLKTSLPTRPDAWKWRSRVWRLPRPQQLRRRETRLHREGTVCETVLRSRRRQSRCLWPDQLAERGGPRTPSLGSNNLPERLTELRKTRLLIRSRIYSKG